MIHRTSQIFFGRVPPNKFWFLIFLYGQIFMLTVKLYVKCQKFLRFIELYDKIHQLVRIYMPLKRSKGIRFSNQIEAGCDRLYFSSAIMHLTDVIF